ncbi:hypothetical protein ACFQZ4_18380 [Catellatospora coxensis]
MPRKRQSGRQREHRATLFWLVVLALAAGGWLWYTYGRPGPRLRPRRPRPPRRPAPPGRPPGRRRRAWTSRSTATRCRSRPTSRVR